MTVTSTTARADYNGNGATTAFTVPFYFLDNSHLLVLRTVIATGVPTTLVLGTDYTVTGAGVSSGGTVTCTTAPASGTKLSVLRNIPLDQQTHYVENDQFPSASHERALDKLTMIVQQQNEVISRSVTVPPSTSGVSTALPAPSANQLVAWDSGGTALTNVDPSSFLTIAGSSGFSDQIFTGDGSTTAFTLSAQPGATANLKVSVGGVQQYPTSNWTLSGNTLTFSTAPANGVTIYANWGTTLGIGVPSDTSVSTAKIQDAAVTTAKVLDGAVTSAKLATSGVALPNGSTATTQTANDNSTKVATTAYVDAKSGGRATPNFVNSSAMIAQRTGAINLSTSKQIGQVDNIAIWASGGAVSAGTLTQATSSVAGTTGYAARAAGVTLTGSGQISHQIYMEARDAVKYKNKTCSFSVKVAHDVGSSINYTLVAKKANSADNFSANTTLATGSATAVTTATGTTLTLTGVAMGDCSNGVALEVQAACGAITTKNFDVTEFQIDVGSSVQTYVAADQEQELARCMRYYEVHGGVVNGHPGMSMVTTAGSQSIGCTQLFAVPKRVAPTLTKNGTWLVNAVNQPVVSAPSVSGYLISSTSSSGGSGYFYPADSTCTVTATAEVTL